MQMVCYNAEKHGQNIAFWPHQTVKKFDKKTGTVVETCPQCGGPLVKEE